MWSTKFCFIVVWIDKKVETWTKRKQQQKRMSRCIFRDKLQRLKKMCTIIKFADQWPNCKCLVIWKLICIHFPILAKNSPATTTRIAFSMCSSNENQFRSFCDPLQQWFMTSKNCLQFWGPSSFHAYVKRSMHESIVLLF